MITQNYLIINRKAHIFSVMKMAGRLAVFTDDGGRPVDFGVVALDDTVYAALCCDEVRNVTLVTDRAGLRNVITVLWHDEESYMSGKHMISETLGKSFSPQNLRINRYAEAIAEKLGEGVFLRVTDSAAKEGMLTCPECGTLNPAGSAYCFDCGAELD